MSVQLQFTPNYAFADGVFEGGAKVSFFLSGTTTPATTYTDDTLATPHPTVIEADASGRFPLIWGANGIDYKAVITASDGSAIATINKVVLGNVSIGQAEDLSVAPIVGLTATNAQAAIAELHTDVDGKASLVSPVFTGLPMASTASLGDASMRIATTQFVANQVIDEDDMVSDSETRPPSQQSVKAYVDSAPNFAQSLGALNSSGYVTLPNGLIVQWGRTASISGGTEAVTFPIAFPSNAIGGMATPEGTSVVTGLVAAYIGGLSTTGATVVLDDESSGTIAANVFWIVWGH